MIDSHKTYLREVVERMVVDAKKQGDVAVFELISLNLGCSPHTPDSGYPGVGLLR